MSRPAHWYPLAGSDPVPGDPSVVAQAASDYASVADAIKTAADRLRAIADLRANTSKAVAAVADKASDVAGKIDRAHGRYVAVGQALGTYASALSRAQSDSLQAYYDAQAAQSDLDSAAARVTRASTAADSAPDTATDDDLARLDRTLTSARHDRDDADAALAAARRKLDAATDDRDRAARQATETIRDAVKADGLKDSWWKNFTATIAPYCAVISKIAGIIASVAGVLALVLCWVPVLGEVLAAVAAIATAVKLLADLGLVADGKGSWGDVGWDVFALATFGAGRVLGVAARSVGTGSRAVARIEGTALMRSMSRLQRVNAGLPRQAGPSAFRSLLGEGAPASRLVARTQLRTSATTFLGALRQGSTWETLHPKEIFGLFTRLDEISFGQGAQNLGAGLRDWRAMAGALQGDTALTNLGTGVGQTSAVILEHSTGARAAMTNANVAFTALSGFTTLGSVDTTVGIRGMVDAVHDGTPLSVSILSPFTDVPSLWAPSPVDRLHLP
ncbi:hypothetical protein [Cellulomonas alba]|uniref:Uncharacterized protein n=1 Tax=Cellulomonas alba TaxID=3053467 RepID=A0ABT7SHT0_9CELL|nr:hypothetical protein [Cellulomonas alba]MDM7855107.1 hypothetical protein [Cellulomonas alba]